MTGVDLVPRELADFSPNGIKLTFGRICR
jgi:hypothetical protein